jgi:hypothetical protein
MDDEPTSIKAIIGYSPRTVWNPIIAAPIPANSRSQVPVAGRLMRTDEPPKAEL